MIEKKDRLNMLLATRSVYRSGFGGILHDGRIVDRRNFPDAIPISKYTEFGIPESRELPVKQGVAKQVNN